MPDFTRVSTSSPGLGRRKHKKGASCRRSVVVGSDVMESRHGRGGRLQGHDLMAESEHRYRSIMMTVKNCVVIFDFVTKRLIEGNAAFEKMSGYQQHELSSHTIYDIIIDHGTAINDVVGALKAGQYVEMGEQYYRSKTNTIFTVEAGAMLVSIGSRKAVCIIGNDVTIHHRLTSALKHSEELYRTLYENNTAAMLLINPLTSMIIGANPTARSFYGWNKGTFHQKHLTDIVASPDKGKSGEIAFTLHGSAQHYFMRQRIANGAVREVEVYASPVRLPHTQLMYAIVHDVTEKVKAEEELRQSREDLRRFAAHMETVREQERSHIAREVHDELGQALTALKMDTRWIEKVFGDTATLLREKTIAMQRLIDVTVKSVQRISSQLRPGVLDDLGIGAAIEWQTEEFEERMNIRCLLRIKPEEIEVENAIATTVFRIFQETLTNIARHAGATVVHISLRKANGIVSLTVRDNGKGIVEEEINDKKSIGLIGIRERALSHNGTVAIVGRRGLGTAIVVKIPVLL